MDRFGEEGIKIGFHRSEGSPDLTLDPANEIGPASGTPGRGRAARE
jgi:hypothetical protein